MNKKKNAYDECIQIQSFEIEREIPNFKIFASPPRDPHTPIFQKISDSLK